MRIEHLPGPRRNRISRTSIVCGHFEHSLDAILMETRPLKQLTTKSVRFICALIHFFY